jgi:hypothetical protein
MKTIIYTFSGGDSYNKNKQLEQIKKHELLLENEPIIQEIHDLINLDESLEKIKDSKIIILREDINLQKFENIVRSEYKNLKELEVIPELFYRTKLKETNNSAYSFKEALTSGVMINRIILPINFPFSAKDFINNPTNPQTSYQLIVDPEYGLWFPFIEEIVKYLPGVQDLFKGAVEKDIPYCDTNVLFTIKLASNPNINNIKNSLDSIKTYAVPVYSTAQKIYNEVKRKKVQLDQEKIDKLSAENTQILNVVKGIMINLEGAQNYKPNTNMIGRNRYEQRQSIASKVAQATGADKDLQTSAGSLRKAGLGLVVDAAEGIIKHYKDKSDKEKKEIEGGDELKAFLSHPNIEELLKGLFQGFTSKYFVEKLQ